VDACRPYLALPHFNRDIIYNKSRAAAGMCEYALNIIKYFDVVTMIEPKRLELAEANATLEEANSTLTTVKARVAELNALVAELERQFKEVCAPSTLSLSLSLSLSLRVCVSLTVPLSPSVSVCLSLTVCLFLRVSL
jgi:dynein heavy chain